MPILTRIRSNGKQPPMFIELALFLVRPDRTLYYASVQSMPFGRPSFKEMFGSIEKAIARDTPARGEVTYENFG